MKRFNQFLSESVPSNFDKATCDVPLFIRLLEYAKEDAQTDLQLHELPERAIKLSKTKVLEMSDYNYLVGE